MELKFDPGFRVIGEYLSQTDSILRVNLKNWPNFLGQNDSIFSFSAKNCLQTRKPNFISFKFIKGFKIRFVLRNSLVTLCQPIKFAAQKFDDKFGVFHRKLIRNWKDFNASPIMYFNCYWLYGLTMNKFSEFVE